MRAAIFLEANAPLSVEDVTPLDPGARDVVVRIDASGVCHSDLSVMNGTIRGRAQIMGHEGAGVVEAVGADVRSVEVGDRVIGSFIPACGTCWYCSRGQSQLCEQTVPVMRNRRARRVDGTELTAFTGLGTFAELMTVAEESVVRIDTDLPSEQLALLGCGVTTGVGAALDTAQVAAGSTVVVIGCGGVGQSVIQGARIADAARIVAIDPVLLKRESALGLGATDTLDPTGVDVVEAVRDLTEGRGADYAFEVIGTGATLRTAFDCTRNGGTTVAVGMHGMHDDVAIPSYPLVLGAKRLLGCVYGNAQVREAFPRLVRYVEEGRLDIGSMVSRTVALDDVNEAFRAMQSGEVIRSVVV